MDAPESQFETASLGRLTLNDPYGFNQSANTFFEQQCASASYDEELIKRAIKAEAAAINCQGKTEVSLLHELLSKRGKTPKYELLQTEGETHEPTFRYKVTFGNDYGIGSASSKKQAKHQAARELLRIYGVDVSKFDHPSKEGVDGAQEGDDDMANPIGRLQEMCTLKRWTPPTYETHMEEGEPHKKNFVMSCTVMDFKEVGEGSSKKMAKRRAAQKILKLLRSQAEKEFGDLFLDRFKDIKDLPIEKMTPSSEHEQEQFRRTMKANNTPALQELNKMCIHMTPLKPQLDDILHRIAAENNFKVIKVPIEEKSVTGQHMFMIELTTVPIAVCQGKGESVEEAETGAIIATLDFLKLLTK